VAAEKNAMLLSMIRKLRTGFFRFFKRNGGIILGLVILCVVISIASPIFVSAKNILNVLRQISTNLYVAVAMTILFIAGGIDLSVGSIIAVVGVFAATLVGFGIPPVMVVFLALVAGSCVGFVNGTIISRTTLNPFLVTFSMASVLRGAAYIYTGGTTVRIDNRKFINIGTGYLGFVPLPVIYLFILLIIIYFLMNKSRMGRHIYATGGNEVAAKFAGINVRRIHLFSYVFSGLMAAMSSIIITTRSYSGNPTAGEGAEMDAIAAVALGGTSMAGGNGFVGGTVIGALIIGVMNNGLNLMGIDSFWQMSLKGLLILTAVYVDYLKRTGKLWKK
jgi:ribose transport system permease protein